MKWSLLLISASIFAVTVIITGIFKVRVPTIEGVKTEVKIPLESNDRQDKNKDMTALDAIGVEGSALKIKDSMFLKDMTSRDMNEHLERKADRQGFSEEKKAEMMKTLERLSRYMPMKEAYKLILIRFNLSDMEEFKDAGDSDYQKPIGVTSR